MDAFALPVIVSDVTLVLSVMTCSPFSCFLFSLQGSETRVNPGAEANAYMVTYQEASAKVSRREPIVGWYHSHPGYGCWLSGIDVETQKLYQQHQDPFVAIVVSLFGTPNTTNTVEEQKRG